MADTKEIYFIKQFIKFTKEDVKAKTLGQLSYLANQILGVGACGDFNPDEHKDFIQSEKPALPVNEFLEKPLTTQVR